MDKSRKDQLISKALFCLEFTFCARTIEPTTGWIVSQKSRICAVCSLCTLDAIKPEIWNFNFRSFFRQKCK